MSDCYAGIPDEVLDSTWRDVDLARLAVHLVRWEELAPFWGLTEAEEEAIKSDNPGKYDAQKLAALRRWKAKSPETATYRQLVRVFQRMGKMGLVEKVREIALTPNEIPTGLPVDVLSSYRQFLEKSCSQLPHPGVLTHQWPIANSAAYVQLPLSKRPRTQHGRMEQLPTISTPFLSLLYKTRKPVAQEPEEQEVHLPQLLSECSGGKSRSIVIQGVPGSGKTTLMWHTNQQWAKGELFQQFSLFLSIPLRSIRVQQATCLADLIPHPDQEQRKAISQAISASNGEDVCFWFDGWDEMPQEVQRESFVASFIRRDSPGSSLPRCTIVVSTRPEASLKSSEEMWLNGPSADQVNEIITKSVEGTDHDPSELITSLEKNTSLQAFCLTVPINVAIMISLFFLFRSGLPNTQTELFKCLVLNLLLHNLQSRWKLGITALKSFAALPDSPAESFRAICKLAFSGIMNRKTVFFRSDVPSLQKQQALSCLTLNLMKISPQMEWYGVEEELTFLHTTLQEFLAAVHITTLENGEKLRIVKEIVESKSWYQKSVLQFYVGLVGLDTDSEIFAIIFQKCSAALSNPVGLLSHGFEMSESLSSLVTFVNCIYEAQCGQLCQKLTQHAIFSKNFDMCLTFRSTRFNTADFSHLGYFIGWFCQQKTCELNFENCYISPQQFEVFVNQVKQVLNTAELHRPLLSLIHSEMGPISCSVPAELRCERIRALCGLIKDTYLVSLFKTELPLHSNRSLGPEFTHYCAAMKSIVEAFTRNSSCSSLILQFDIILLFSTLSTMSMVARYSEYYAVLLITFCKSVKELTLCDFFHHWRYAYPLFACALRCNTNIQYLNLSKFNIMCREAIASIARALGYNGTLKAIVFGDWLSTEQLAIFLASYGEQSVCSNCTSGLDKVFVGLRAFPGERENQILRMINFTRQVLSRGLFQVIKYVDPDDGWTSSYYVVYTGFNKYVFDPNDDKSKSDEHSDSD